MRRTLWEALIVAIIIAYLPILNFLDVNPYAYFMYQFDLTTFGFVILIFLIAPAAVLAALGRAAPRLFSPRAATMAFVLFTLIVIFRQFELLYLRPWAKASEYGFIRPFIPIPYFALAIWACWRWRNRLREYVAILGTLALLAAGVMTYSHGYRVWDIQESRKAGRQVERKLAGNNIYVLLVDGFSTEYIKKKSGYVDEEVAPNFARFVKDEAIWSPENVTNGTNTFVSVPTIVTGRVNATNPWGTLRGQTTMLTLAESRYHVSSFVPTLNLSCIPVRQECYPKYKPPDPAVSLRMLIYSYLKFTERRLLRFLESDRQTDWRTITVQRNLETDVMPLATEVLSKRKGTGHFTFVHTSFPKGFIEKGRLGDMSQGELRRWMLSDIQKWDLRFGGFISALKQTGTYEKTIIAVVSDHGKDIAQSELYGPKTEPGRVILRTPLAIKPLGIPVPRLLRKMTQNIDLLPTLAHLAGWKLPREFTARLDGRSVIDPQYRERPHFFGIIGDGLFRYDWKTESYSRATLTELEKFGITSKN
ncbi:MAG TPA: hypothetical protein DDZ83_11405 [Nitrospinae bacterium]|nr:hypothetical protein [Nitrospinota bacterium]